MTTSYDFILHIIVISIQLEEFIVLIRNLNSPFFSPKNVMRFYIITGTVSILLEMLLWSIIPIGLIVKEVLVYVCIILILKHYFRFKLPYCFYFIVFFTLLGTVSISLSLILLYILGFRELNFDNTFIYFLSATLYLFFLTIGLRASSYFKFHKHLPSKIRTKAAISKVPYTVYIILNAASSLSYYVYSYDSYTNKWIILINILVLCYLTYCYFKFHNGFYDFKNVLDLLDEKNIVIFSMNNELNAANEELREYTTVLEQLAIIKERNRVARDMHDTLGRTMTLTITLLEMSLIYFDSDEEKTREKVLDAIAISRSGLQELQNSISGPKSQDFIENSLVHSLNDLICNYQASGLNVGFHVDGNENYGNKMYYDAVYKACQEALTNSLRHGKAKNISIELQFRESRIKLLISDDGYGCKNIKKGMGLTGMEQEIKNLNGSIVYGSDGQGGFNINIELSNNL